MLGSPISHSLSPVLHRAAYAALGLDWNYDAIEVGEADLPGFIDACGPEWVGVSLTMPLKAAVLPLLAETTDNVDLAGAANTVLFTDTGPIGDNTDIPGMRRAMADATGEANARIVSAAILGGGATARSALVALESMGARDVHVGLRSPARGVELEQVARALHVTLHLHPWDEIGHHLDVDAVVSTVPSGAADRFADNVPTSAGILLDVAYGAPSRLLDAWRARAAPAADGLDLLLWQAVDQVRLMTGLDAPVEDMRRALIGAGTRP